MDRFIHLSSRTSLMISALPHNSCPKPKGDSYVKWPAHSQEGDTCNINVAGDLAVHGMCVRSEKGFLFQVAPVRHLKRVHDRTLAFRRVVCILPSPLSLDWRSTRATDVDEIASDMLWDPLPCSHPIPSHPISSKENCTPTQTPSLIPRIPETASAHGPTHSAKSPARPSPESSPSPPAPSPSP